MKKIAAACAAIAMLWNVAARAGVVVEQSETVSGTRGPASGAHQRTVMVEGHKEKVILEGGRFMIVDLDKGTLRMVNGATKTYFESPFPPKGPQGQMVRQFIGDRFGYKKTGNTRTVAGYKCEEYTTSTKTPNSESSSTACYSTEAPGAAEYAAFQKAAALKLEQATGGGATETGSMPGGIPLATNSSRKLLSISIPGLSPEQAAKMSQIIANHPPMLSETTVTKITTQTLPADTFSIPEGYTKREMPGPRPGIAGMGGPMGGMRSGNVMGVPPLAMPPSAPGGAPVLPTGPNTNALPH